MFYIYSIGFGVPLFIYLIMNFMFKVKIPLVVNICIYGYSFTILAPILILCAIPNDLTESIFLIYAFLHSSVFLVYNMWSVIVQKSEKSKYVILGILMGFQCVIYLLLKFYFFGGVINKKN